MPSPPLGPCGHARRPCSASVLGTLFAARHAHNRSPTTVRVHTRDPGTHAPRRLLRCPRRPSPCFPAAFKGLDVAAVREMEAKLQACASAVRDCRETMGIFSYNHNKKAAKKAMKDL